ncbi:unnamed protein product [Acanthoscelides obtectus]|uniref:Uncharacterized protein n=1 Tax=Acanthoscelides obtectus TaxID=200917 RepID=A0A9P0KAR7_ACAOB|nr:unnamed protein product [Acanthoscelides obtectus]CAK1648305.1 hypothetical protein AOBTE_LOCUS15667 [Acanthoscelides obtectus]
MQIAPRERDKELAGMTSYIEAFIKKLEFWELNLTDGDTRISTKLPYWRSLLFHPPWKLMSNSLQLLLRRILAKTQKWK